MAGHSKWANIQHRKGRQDAKRAKAFTKAAKEIIIAAKHGGDPAANARLRAAIQAAKAVNLPKDKIENAIKKGTGELAGGEIFEVMYEGYGPGGVAILVEAATDNKNRTVADVRHALTKGGGSMGEAGCVNWMFDKKGVIIVSHEQADEEKIMELGLEAGAEDILEDDDVWELRVAPTDMEAVETALADAGVEMLSAELAMLPQNTVAVAADVAKKILRLLDTLEENDDVQNVWSNVDMPDDVLEELS